MHYFLIKHSREYFWKRVFSNYIPTNELFKNPSFINGFFGNCIIKYTYGFFTFC